jgi:hypothetical protein
MKHDWQSIPMPPGIAALGRDVRGFPITFTTLIQSDGRPDFTTIDGEKIMRCIEEGLCGMCGTKLRWSSLAGRGAVQLEPSWIQPCIWSARSTPPECAHT